MKPFPPVVANIQIKGLESQDRSTGIGVTINHKRVPVSPKTKPYGFFAIAALLVLPGYPSQKSNTCIVIIRSSDEIVAASDSKALQGGTVALPSCKVIQAYRNVFFAASGMTDYPPTKFSADFLARNAATEQGSIATKAARFGNLLVKELTGALVAIRRDFPENYKRGDLPDGVIFSAAFFGFENGIPVLCERTWIKTTSSKGEIAVTLERSRDCPGKDCVDEVMFSPLGQVEAVLAWKAQYKSWNLHPLDVAHFMVAFEAIANPNKVGGTINILRVRKEGAQWVQRDRAHCQDIEPY